MRQLKAAVQLHAVLLLAAMLLQAAHPAHAVLQDSASSSAATETSAVNQRQQVLPNNHLWIVQLKIVPAVAYSGGIQGLAATMAQPPNSAGVSSDQPSTLPAAAVVTLLDPVVGLALLLPLLQLCSTHRTSQRRQRQQ
ncbi:hypothetical protein COO60DRAFT_865404 [Scenedesmus sp. NREL 46B-D3]|nr:hypothetical protein COO60DRAFT_865404 [Scenedesmus sp. NREL 46B-D3]